MEGVAIALATWLRTDLILGGVYCYQGVLAAKIDWSQVDTKKKKKTPVVLFSGDDDGWMKRPIVRRTFENMKIDGKLDHIVWRTEAGV
jgi:hypothetical protein